jgi:hypothetical protein
MSGHLVAVAGEFFYIPFKLRQAPNVPALRSAHGAQQSFALRRVAQGYCPADVLAEIRTKHILDRHRCSAISRYNADVSSSRLPRGRDCEHWAQAGGT